LKDEPASGLDCSGNQSRAGYPFDTGRPQVAGMYCAGHQTSSCGKSKTLPAEGTRSSPAIR